MVPAETINSIGMLNDVNYLISVLVPAYQEEHCQGKEAERIWYGGSSEQ